jgi:LPLT family lysophospholipid transporter-like MFS transporter
MNKKIYPLLLAQFLSAFADNAVLFSVIAMVMQSTNKAAWYVPALQSVFLVAFVVLAPWVGGLADNYPKSRVLIAANLLKALGAGLLLFHVEPLLAYCIVGAGAAIYSPAKYGILPELAGHSFLVKANSWVEGSTIFAILLGMVIGSKVADYSVSLALLGTIVLYIASALCTLFLPIRVIKNVSSEALLLQFWRQMLVFLGSSRSRFAVLGGALFWCAAATLRVILVAWAPLILLSKNASEIAELTLLLAVGIIVGSALAPRLIPLEHLRRVRVPAYLMALFIGLLGFTHDLWMARTVLFFIGAAGGAFIVPINAALQEMGSESIGSGYAVALQGFFQNIAMLLGVGVYAYAASVQVNPVTAMWFLSGLVFICTLAITFNLPKTTLKH